MLKKLLLVMVVMFGASCGGGKGKNKTSAQNQTNNQTNGPTGGVVDNEEATQLEEDIDTITSEKGEIVKSNKTKDSKITSLQSDQQKLADENQELQNKINDAGDEDGNSQAISDAQKELSELNKTNKVLLELLKKGAEEELESLLDGKTKETKDEFKSIIGGKALKGYLSLQQKRKNEEYKGKFYKEKMKYLFTERKILIEKVDPKTKDKTKVRVTLQDVAKEILKFADHDPVADAVSTAIKLDTAARDAATKLLSNPMDPELLAARDAANAAKATFRDIDTVTAAAHDTANASYINATKTYDVPAVRLATVNVAKTLPVDDSAYVSFGITQLKEFLNVVNGRIKQREAVIDAYIKGANIITKKIYKIKPISGKKLRPGLYPEVFDIYRRINGLKDNKQGGTLDPNFAIYPGDPTPFNIHIAKSHAVKQLQDLITEKEKERKDFKEKFEEALAQFEELFKEYEKDTIEKIKQSKEKLQKYANKELSFANDPPLSFSGNDTNPDTKKYFNSEDESNEYNTNQALKNLEEILKDPDKTLKWSGVIDLVLKVEKEKKDIDSNHIIEQFCVNKENEMYEKVLNNSDETTLGKFYSTFYGEKISVATTSGRINRDGSNFTENFGEEEIRKRIYNAICYYDDGSGTGTYKKLDPITGTTPALSGVGLNFDGNGDATAPNNPIDKLVSEEVKNILDNEYPGYDILLKADLNPIKILRKAFLNIDLGNIAIYYTGRSKTEDDFAVDVISGYENSGKSSEDLMKAVNKMYDLYKGIYADAKKHGKLRKFTV